MQINIAEIEKIAFLLLSKFKESKGDTIDLSHDFYWDIPSDELFNPYQEPQNMTLGQLSDDLSEIQRLNTSDSAIPYDLKRLASILTALSMENQTAF